MENKDAQEIDLGEVFQKVKNFFESFIVNFFKLVKYIQKNILKIGIVFIIGIILGYLLDEASVSYKQEIIVTPNVKSVDYLYKRIDLLNSFLKENDSNYLYKKGFRNIENIKKIEIEHIVDVFKFVESYKETNSNFDMIKLMAEDGDLNKIIESGITSKNYPFHLISFSSSAKLNEEITKKSIMLFLNENEYYQKVLKQENENSSNKIKQNDSIIKQIDLILESFKTSSSSSKSSSLVYYNENTQLNDIINTKNQLVSENGYLKAELISKDAVIKDVSHTFNIKKDNGTNGILIFILPFASVISFLLFIGFLKIQKKYSK
jgi:hypothetical protein